jgi:hypothetical protein
MSAHLPGDVLRLVFESSLNYASLKDIMLVSEEWKVRRPGQYLSSLIISLCDRAV